MDGSVYNLNVPLDVDPKNVFSLYRFTTGCFFFYQLSGGGGGELSLFAWGGAGDTYGLAWRCMSFQTISSSQCSRVHFFLQAYFSVQ